MKVLFFEKVVFMSWLKHTMVIGLMVSPTMFDKLIHQLQLIPTVLCSVCIFIYGLGPAVLGVNNIMNEYYRIQQLLSDSVCPQ